MPLLPRKWLEMNQNVTFLRFMLQSLCLLTFFHFSSLQMLDIITIVLSLTFATKGEKHSAFFRVMEDRFLVDENIIWDEKGESLLSCSQKCARREDCKSANFMTDDGTCFLLSKRRTENTKMHLQIEGSFYLEKVGFMSLNLMLICFER